MFVLKQVLRSDVEAALRVLNFAIYHQELSEMEEREEVRMREMERESRMDTETGNNDGGGRRSGRNKTTNPDSTATTGYLQNATDVEDACFTLSIY